MRNEETWIARKSARGREKVGRNDRETDVGIIRVDNPSGWRFGQPWITVDPTGKHRANSSYVIRRTRDPKKGDRVCATVLELSAEPSSIQTTMTAATHSASGAAMPLMVFSEFRAFAQDPEILGLPVSSPKGQNRNGPHSSCFTNAEPISEAQSRMNVNVITA